MAVSRRLRYEILRRDQSRCHYCGAAAPEVKLTVDHVTPVALGGSDDPSNLVAACAGCNGGKSASSPDAPLVAAVDEKAAQFANAMNRVIEERAAKQADDGKVLRWFDKIWRGWTQPAIERDADWETSILRFHAVGVTKDYMQRAVNSAMSNRTVRTDKVWRYFCGICWNEVRSIQDEAAKLAGQVAPAAAVPPRSDSVPWACLADRLVGDLFNLITLIEDDGAGEDFYAYLSNAVYAGLQDLQEGYLAAQERGVDQIIAEDMAVNRLIDEGGRYAPLVGDLRKAFLRAYGGHEVVQNDMWRHFSDHVLEDIGRRLGADGKMSWSLLTTFGAGIRTMALEYVEASGEGLSERAASERAEASLLTNDAYLRWADEMGALFEPGESD